MWTYSFLSTNVFFNIPDGPKMILKNLQLMCKKYKQYETKWSKNNLKITFLDIFNFLIMRILICKILFFSSEKRIDLCFTSPVILLLLSQKWFFSVKQSGRLHNKLKLRVNCLKLCGNCAFPQNFHTRKFGEITNF